jgi:cellulose synthase/poly-beta-1,6-N-acetylglucosamine synthase-like glycosyltransferase
MAAPIVGGAVAAMWLYLIAFRGGFWWVRWRPVAGWGVPPRSIVAVIPARDEAAVIDRAIASLLAQRYPGPFHILIVDDQSSDGTAEVARAAAAASGSVDRLTVVAARPLPGGWTGKLWAVHQGIE